MPWTVHNYADESGGYMNLLDATANSVNTIFAQLVDIVGPDNVAVTAHKMGITTPLQPVCSITLGSQPVNPLEMTSAYATLAARGVHRDPQAFELVRGPRGDVIGGPTAPGVRAIPQNTADLVTYALEGVVSHGTGTAAYFGRPAAGKTGTAENFQDAWFCGYVPQLAACVWVGYPKAEIPLLNVEGWSAVFGGSLPAMIWNRFMSAAVAKLPSLDFVYPQFTGHTISSPYSYIPVFDYDDDHGLDDDGRRSLGAKPPVAPEPPPLTTPSPTPPPPTTTPGPGRSPVVAAMSLLNRLDAAIGSGVERSTRAHHGRRLARRGHARAFDPPPGGWAASGTFAPRAGSAVEFLVDGAEVLPRMVADVSAAESHVHVAGWFFTPGFRMGAGGPTLRELLADAAGRVDVRVLAWAGAPLPLFLHLDRGEVREMREELTRGTRIQMQLDANELADALPSREARPRRRSCRIRRRDRSHLVRWQPPRLDLA